MLQHHEMAHRLGCACECLQLWMKKATRRSPSSF